MAEAAATQEAGQAAQPKSLTTSWWTTGTCQTGDVHGSDLSSVPNSNRTPAASKATWGYPGQGGFE